MVNRYQREHTQAERSPAERVMAFLRKSRAQGFGGRSFETILYGAHFTDRDQLSALLSRLEESGRIVREPGAAIEGSYERRADTWRVS